MSELQDVRIAKTAVMDPDKPMPVWAQRAGVEAAKRIANPDLGAMLRVLWEHFYDDMEGNPSDFDEAWVLNWEWSEIQMSGLPERLWNAALGITTKDDE